MQVSIYTGGSSSSSHSITVIHKIGTKKARRLMQKMFITKNMLKCISCKSISHNISFTIAKFKHHLVAHFAKLYDVPYQLLVTHLCCCVPAKETNRNCRISRNIDILELQVNSKSKSFTNSNQFCSNIRSNTNIDRFKSNKLALHITNNHPNSSHSGV